MSAPENEALVRRLIAALQARDVAALGDLLTDDVVYHFPGRGPMAGTYEGKDAVFGAFRGFGAILGPIELRNHDLLVGDDHVAELAVNAADRDGRHLEWRAVRLYHFRDGRISEIWVLLEDPYALDEFMA